MLKALQTIDQVAPLATYSVARLERWLRNPLEALGWHAVLDSAASASGTSSDTGPSGRDIGA
jgi:hypothetical protein